MQNHQVTLEEAALCALRLLTHLRFEIEKRSINKGNARSTFLSSTSNASLVGHHDLRTRNLDPVPRKEAKINVPQDVFLEKDFMVSLT